jgi:hypothetical protein
MDDIHQVEIVIHVDETLSMVCMEDVSGHLLDTLRSARDRLPA